MLELNVDVAKSKVNSRYENGNVRSSTFWRETERKTIKAVRRIGWGGGVCYEGQDLNGEWHHLYKSKNKGVNLPVLDQLHHVVELAA